jgi:fatty-acyl-CoA synthase
MIALLDDVAVQARLQPNRLAAVDLASGRRWTYADLDRDIGACAAVLAAQGLVAGERLAAFARNHVLLLILHAACARTGIIYVPLNWRLSDDEIAAIIADCEPSLLVHDDGNARGVAAVALGALDEMIAAAEPAVSIGHDAHRPSLILYSSGTTGVPKGAVLSERNLAESAINTSMLSQVGRESRVLTDSPMFHVIGLVTNVRPYWLRGGAVLVSDGFDCSRTLARMSDPDLGVTHYFCVPAMAAMLRRHPDYDPAKLRGLTAIFTGGAPNPAADILAFLDDGIPMVNGYGMTENGTLIGMPIEIDQIRKRLDAAGIPTARVQMRVVDHVGAVLPANMAGEIQVRGPNLGSGYWRKPEETARSFLPDGWFATGDIGIIDQDGFVSVVDRKKDMFISGGENVYPAEIEAAIAGLPGLAEAAVIGVPHPKWGEVGHIAVVPEAGATLDAAAVLAHLDGRLARYKIPKYVAVLDALPRNGAGKVQKALLRAMMPPSDQDGELTGLASGAATDAATRSPSAVEAA